MQASPWSNQATALGVRGGPPIGAFVPIHTMPSWIRGFAGNQPATPVIETLRGLLLDSPIGASPWRAIAWCSGILLASLAVSGALFARRTA